MIKILNYPLLMVLLSENRTREGQIYLSEIKLEGSIYKGWMVNQHLFPI